MATLITSERYNNLQNRVSAVLKTAYGQILYSAPVQGHVGESITNAYKVSTEDYKNLYIDLARARAHQIGDSFVASPFVTTANKITNTYMTSLESLMTAVEQDVDVISTNQDQLQFLKNANGDVILSTKDNGWNTSISHVFTVKFSSQLARNQFFNAGGNLQITLTDDIVLSTVPAQSRTKTSDWKTLINGGGTITFGKSITTRSGAVGKAYDVGNTNLSSTPILCFSSISAAYPANNFSIYAELTNTATIKFTVVLVDAQVEDIDYLVYSNITSRVRWLQAAGSVSVNGTEYPTVVIPSPIGANIAEFNPDEDPVTVSVTYELIGGGGGGGFGVDDGGEQYRGTYGGTGGTSSLSATGIVPVYAYGGQGGENCGNGRAAGGTAGQASYYGSGGAFTGNKNRGNPAPVTSYGAAGAGGGGDSSNYFLGIQTDSSGCGGLGGLASARLTGTIIVPIGSTLNITIGPAGVGGASGYQGGKGAAGYCKITYAGSSYTYTESGTRVIA